MTDALLPTTPQPLEKERDDYFRKVRGEPADSLCLRKLQSTLLGFVAGVCLDQRGRRKEGMMRAAQRGREGVKGLRGAGRPERMAVELGRAGARTSQAQVGTWGGDHGGPASLLRPVWKGLAAGHAGELCPSELRPELSLHPSA